MCSENALVNRPWGNYSIVKSGERFKVKQINVDPGKRLSLQRHHHRSEHWVVVHGTAEVIVGTTHMLLCVGQSTYISAGTLHRLGNPGKIPLEVIEVSTGEYIEEDDIERIEDDFSRN